MWSDYVYKLCEHCGHKSYHLRELPICRSCDLDHIEQGIRWAECAGHSQHPLKLASR